MAICTIEYFSNKLRQFTKFKAILPNDLPPEMVAGNPHFQRPMQTLILLHGYSGSETDWLYNTQISALAGRYNLAILCPNGGNSFYLDGPETGRQYGASSAGSCRTMPPGSSASPGTGPIPSSAASPWAASARSTRLCNIRSGFPR